MNEQRTSRASIGAAALAALLCTQPLHAFPTFAADTGVFAEPVAAVEYYNAEHDQYFVTTLQSEMQALDAGAFAGWARTSQGLAFHAFDEFVRASNVPAAQARARPVCRFFVPPASHFMSVFEHECEAVAGAHPEFTLETSAAFYAWAPTAAGECPRPFAKIGGFAFAPVYRLWNGRADTNHRYTASKAERDALAARGWVPEGYGDDGVAFCVPRWMAD